MDWYFENNGVNYYTKKEAILNVARLIDHCAPKTEFWVQRIQMYQAIAFTGLDPRKVHWKKIFYDTKTKKKMPFKQIPKPLYRVYAADEEATKEGESSTKLGKRSRSPSVETEDGTKEDEDEVTTKKMKPDVEEESEADEEGESEEGESEEEEEEGETEEDE